jgi:hypothetical protein
MDAGTSKSGSNSTEQLPDESIVVTGGTKIKIYEDEDNNGEPSFEVLSRSKLLENTMWMTEVVVFLNDLQNLVRPFIQQQYLPVLTEHKRNNTIFHGHPNFRGLGPWKDWVMIDWGAGYGKLPSHIWCFVELQNMPTGGQRIEFGGIFLSDGVYAVVEVANYNENIDEIVKSDLFTPFLLEVAGMDADGDIMGRKFYLANTDAFIEPCCVVPDIGGAKNAYFQVKPRREWSKTFVTWLEAPHELDEMTYTDEEEQDGR